MQSSTFYLQTKEEYLYFKSIKLLFEYLPYICWYLTIFTATEFLLNWTGSTKQETNFPVIYHKDKTTKKEIWGYTLLVNIHPVTKVLNVKRCMIRLLVIYTCCLRNQL